MQKHNPYVLCVKSQSSKLLWIAASLRHMPPCAHIGAVVLTAIMSSKYHFILHSRLHFVLFRLLSSALQWREKKPVLSH